MPHPVFLTEECSGCGICVDTCPNGVIEIVGDHADAVNEDECIGCELCLEECPMGAIREIAED